MSNGNGSRNGNGAPAAGLRASLFPGSIRCGEQAQKVPGRTVIAHISDLHFRSGTDASKLPWNALLADLARQEVKPDVIAVTGDLVDSPFGGVFGFRDEATAAFENVCTYLEDLCRELEIDPATGLVVVPGNHDYRLSGIVRDRHQPRKFYDKFGGYCRPLLLPSLRLCLFAMDSNQMERTLDLAAGTVERNDLVNFGTLVGQVPGGHSDCTKVVLLHHHPMPIASTENSSRFDDPRYTLLKNAGQFMTNMVKAGVSLILHGHQHAPGYSKAVFPYGRGKEHMITVVAAGSSGRQVEEYNLITVTDGGKIDLERRSLRGNTYFDQEGDARSVLSYDDARRASFEGLAGDAGARFRVRKFSRLYLVHSGSGDADIYERSEQVEAFGDDVGAFQTFVESKSGFFDRPEYKALWPDNQEVKWVWKTETYDSTLREAQVVFKPSLSKNRLIAYESQRKAYNLFHFYGRDREDATRGRWRQEFIEIIIQNVYDLFVLTLSFPEGHRPKNFYRLAHNRKRCPAADHTFEECAPDPLEQERFDLHFSKFTEAGTVVISLEKPVPGFTYWIYWDLPYEEESKLSAHDAGTARDFERELLRMRDPGGPQREAARRWFEEMRRDIFKAKMWSGLSGNGGPDEMDISLYAYDREQRGLVCVAASLPRRTPPDQPWDEVIEPGTTIVGASYRRQEAMLYSSAVRSPRLGESEYGMRIPESWRADEAKPEDRYAVVCTVPLFCPIPDGRRIAVLAFASKQPSSRLTHFVPQRRVGADSDRLKAIKAAHKTLLEELMVVQCMKLADALGVALPAPGQA
ncbi:MAG TPA: metallophosphoesterase [Pyrinomonadaceae bacterium]|nr:metallophosphoesterase [Pyrinomonadaceae bacterium]